MNNLIFERTKNIATLFYARRLLGLNMRVFCLKKFKTKISRFFNLFSNRKNLEINIFQIFRYILRKTSDLLVKFIKKLKDFE